MRYKIDQAVLFNQIRSRIDVCMYACNPIWVHDTISLYDIYRAHYALYTAQLL